MVPTVEGLPAATASDKCDTNRSLYRQVPVRRAGTQRLRTRPSGDACKRGSVRAIDRLNAVAAARETVEVVEGMAPQLVAIASKERRSSFVAMSSARAVGCRAIAAKRSTCLARHDSPEVRPPSSNADRGKSSNVKEMYGNVDRITQRSTTVLVHQDADGTCSTRGAATLQEPARSLVRNRN